MATWQRRRKGEVVVQYYDRATKRVRQLSRLETRALDREPDHVLDLWVKNWPYAEVQLDENKTSYFRQGPIFHG